MLKNLRDNGTDGDASEIICGQGLDPRVVRL